MVPAIKFPREMNVETWGLMNNQKHPGEPPPLKPARSLRIGGIFESLLPRTIRPTPNNN